jgi:hypothetical protein
MEDLLTVEQLSKCIHKSVTSIRSDASRNQASLPPICRLPGTKRLLWRMQDVEDWLAKHVQASAAIDKQLAPVAASEKRKRGRPTKAEQIARDRRLAGKTHQPQQLKRA